MKVKITLPFPPIPWCAPKRRGNFYYNPKDKENKRDIQYLKGLIKEEFKGVLKVDMIFFMPIPKSLSKKKTEKLETERVFHYCKPDRDNLQKKISDNLERAGYFKNDSQIAFGSSMKIYSKNPRTEIYIEEIEEML